jgi:hypothetical protein
LPSAVIPIYPEQHFCKRPTTEQIPRPFSLAERHTPLRDAKPIQFFPPQLTESDRKFDPLALISGT